MNLTKKIANQFREAFFGNNWTDSNLKDNLANVTWQQAITKVHNFYTIAALVFHINYYVTAVLKVLEGNQLNASDKYSFDLPPIQSQKDWGNFLNEIWTNIENFCKLIEQMPESKLWENVAVEKYGNYYRNIHGIVEHLHYHLGQIVLIKKLF